MTRVGAEEGQGSETAGASARDPGGLRRRAFLGRSAGAALSVTFLGGALQACGDDDSGDGSGESKGRIAFSFPSRDIDIYPPLLQGARQKGEERGFEILESFSGENLQKQLAEVNTWIAQRIDAITVLPMDVGSYGPVVKRAHENDVKVVAYGIPIKGQDGLVNLDHEQGGRVIGEHAGKWVNENLGGTGKAALMVILNDPSSTLRVRTAGERMREIAPDVEIVELAAKLSTPDEGFKFAVNQLQADDQTNIWIPVNDSMALGIDNAVKRVDFDLAKAYVTGFDGSKAALERMQDPASTAIKSTGGLDLVAFGELAIELAANAVEGKKPTTGLQAYQVVSPDNPELVEEFLAQYEA